MELRRNKAANALAGYTGSAADLNDLSGVAVGATISPAAESSHAITTTITLLNAAGAAVGEAMAVKVWLSDAPKGALTGTAPTSSTTVGTGTALHALTANTEYDMITSAGGIMAFTTTQTVAHNYYWNVRLPNGKINSGEVSHLG